MNFLIRADASPEIGSGHVMRCFALGQMLQEKNQRVIFVTKTRNKNLIDKLEREGFLVLLIEQKLNIIDDALATLQIAKENESRWIITDGYKFETKFQREIKAAKYNLMCIDDTAQCHYVSDIILNQNIDADKYLSYSCEKYTKLLIGIDYVLLRREFRNSIGWERKFNNSVERILITMGGSDPENFTLTILKYLQQYNQSKLNISIILGAEYSYSDEINSLMKKSHHSILILKNVQNMCEIIKNCDLAISAGGSTVWELALLQTPMMLGISAENQTHIVDRMSERGCAANLGWFKELSLEKFISVFSELYEDFDKRKELGKNSRNLLSKYSPYNLLSELAL